MKPLEDSAYKAITSLFKQPECFPMYGFGEQLSSDELLDLFAHRLAEVGDKLTIAELAGLAKIGMSTARKNQSVSIEHAK